MSKDNDEIFLSSPIFLKTLERKQVIKGNISDHPFVKFDEASPLMVVPLVLTALLSLLLGLFPGVFPNFYQLQQCLSYQLPIPLRESSHADPFGSLQA